MSDNKQSTNENSITRTKRNRENKKPKISQIPFALIMTAVVIALGFYFGNGNPKLATYWFFGIAFGYVLQRSRFCFTASFRDPYITGSTSVTRGVLIAFAIGSIGVFFIKFAAYLKGGEAVNALIMTGVEPIGIPLFIGAILFGIGMVIAGGCASGTVMRVGEGFIMQILALAFFIIGSLWGAHDAGSFWYNLNKNAPKIFLPQIFEGGFGWFMGAVIQFAIIGLLYIAAVKFQEKKLGTGE